MFFYFICNRIDPVCIAAIATRCRDCLCLFDFQLMTCKSGTISLLLIEYFFIMLLPSVDGNRSRRPLQCLSTIIVNYNYIIK